MKFIAILIASIMIVGMLGFVSAQYGNGNQANVNANANSEGDNHTGDNKSSESNGIGATLSAEIQSKKEALKEGNYSGPLGKLLNVRELSKDLRELRTGNVSVKTDLNITIEKDDKNETHLRTNLSRGKEVEIKVMPDTASATALARLKLKVCSEANNCTIVLKEVGKNNETSADYEVKADQDMKILGLFKAKAHVEAQVDSNTGKIVSSKRPWWASISTTA